MRDLPALAATAAWVAVLAALVTAEMIYLPSRPHLPPHHRPKDWRATIVVGALCYLAALTHGLLPPPTTLLGRAAALLLWLGGITVAIRAGRRAEVRAWANRRLADGLRGLLPAVTAVHEHAPADSERHRLLRAAETQLERHRGRDALLFLDQVLKRSEPEDQRHEEWLRLCQRMVILAAEYAPYLAPRP